MSEDDSVVVPMRGSPRPRATRPGALGADAEVLPFTVPDELPVVPEQPETLGWQQRIASGLAFLRRRLEGDYSVDEFGLDPEFADSVEMPVLRALYEKWFRVEVNGVDHVPSSGGALLVANHAGGLWPIDAAMAAVAVRLETGRFLRPLAADLVFGLPGASTLARRGGATLATSADADRLLRAGELVGVWPEGFKGIGKPFRDRYQLRRFGRGGFVRCAIAAGVPIVPVSIVGAEEVHPVLGNARTLARLLGLPYFPLTPTFPWLGPLGLVPLPSKWYIEFGPAVPTDRLAAEAAGDPQAVFAVTDQVRDRIQATLDRLLAQRASIWR